MSGDEDQDLGPILDGTGSEEQWPTDMMPQMPMPWFVPVGAQMMPQWNEDSDAQQQQQVYAFPGQGGFQPMVWMPADAQQGGEFMSGMPGGYGGGGGGGTGAISMQKQRFCATFPHVGRCRHGFRCAFAHSREEVCAPLLSVAEEMRLPEALTEEFFTQRFKTLWCPIGTQHDWQLCMYAHTYQDVRRPPSIGYGHQLCPYWSKKETTLAYSQRCPLGPRCAYAHGAKEQLYHPGYFRTLICRDLQRRRCPRRQLCSFFHKRQECRVPTPDDVDYGKPLKKENLAPEWLASFLAPPHFQEVPGADDGEGGPVSMTPGAGASFAPFWGCRGDTQVGKDGKGGETPRTQTTEAEDNLEEGEDGVIASSHDAISASLRAGGRGKGFRGKGLSGCGGGKASAWGVPGGGSGSTNTPGDSSGQWGGPVPYFMPYQAGFYPVPEMYSDMGGMPNPASGMYWDPSQAAQAFGTSAGDMSQKKSKPKKELTNKRVPAASP